ncbi:flagellin [uncultured Oceanicoccus sp.]|uniref:flagellin N-terminal helical domain-containing protein n=1 Tax=uncultured Oceanicoccus sp. TaxID=1706381 RepID=UPI0030D9A7ED
MPQIINTNIASLNAQRNLEISQGAIQTSLERLSTGLRINTAKDDVAGFAMVDRFTSQIRGLNQAARNANDGISVLQVAEGAMGESINILQRLRELAIQATNGTYTVADRDNFNKEVAQLQQELTRIADTTQFGTQRLLDGSFGQQSLQIGANAEETIDINLGSGFAAEDNSGGFAVTAEKLEGFSDKSRTTSFTANPGDSITLSAIGGSSKTISLTDGISARDLATAYNGLAELSGVKATTEINIGNFPTSAGDVISIMVGKITFSATASSGNSSADIATKLLTDLEQKGGPPTGVTITADGSGGLDIIDTDGDNLAYELDLTSSSKITINDVEFGGGGDFEITLIHTGSLDFTNAVSTRDIELEFAGIVSGGAITLGDPLSVASIDLSTAEGAQQAIGITDAAITTINNSRADIAAIQNRLESTISNLSNISENISAARSQIQDADFAEETANLTRNQILQQAGISILSQANALPQQILALLQ